ncbi:cupin domain-containing protein [Bacillus lacus]|uniref:Cupin domain-containing protein n=1 Tax=Metabacillus lacus TaxID=1983721 RepID=A0A7X2LWV9_9BACI|nr:cupin domain-containing protein [Metabacillus lacus]MRX71900.1 cupin domain-containing protein [Metabacillus lacus]
MTANSDYTSPQYFFDVNKSNLFKQDQHNLINVMGKKQLNTLENVSLLDIFLSAEHVVEPHYHQNAAELVYCISGSATVSILNPYTKQLLNIPITPGQVANVPKGWWHYEVASVNNTHLLAIFDAPNPEVILGSDLLKFTPSNIMAHTYCINEEQWKAVTHSIKPSTYIGPYKNCNKRNLAHHQNQYAQQPYQPYLQYPRYPNYPY